MAKRQTNELEQTTLAKATAVVIGNGLSLTQADIDTLRPHAGHGGVFVIVVNDAWKCFPEADVLYAADYDWWTASEKKVKEQFHGECATIDPHAAAYYELTLVPCEDLHKPLPGLSPQGSDMIRHGYSSGFQAVQIAMLRGANKIILLGFDYGATGQGNAIPGPFNRHSDFPVMVEAFNKAAPDFASRGVQVINATRETALTCFERQELNDALAS